MNLAVGVLLFEGVDELDAIGPARVFWALDDIRPYVDPFGHVDVHLVSESGGAVTGAHGLPLKATTSFARCPALDVVIATGGASDGGNETGRRREQQNPATQQFLRSQPGLVASVCTGAFLLAAAGLLDGRRATTHWTARQELAVQFPTVTVVGERVVDDGDRVTAGGVTSGIDLALHLVGRLLGHPRRAAAEAALELTTP